MMMKSWRGKVSLLSGVVQQRPPQHGALTAACWLKIGRPLVGRWHDSTALCSVRVLPWIPNTASSSSLSSRLPRDAAAGTVRATSSIKDEDDDTYTKRRTWEHRAALRKEQKRRATDASWWFQYRRNLLHSLSNINNDMTVALSHAVWIQVRRSLVRLDGDTVSSTQENLVQAWQLLDILLQDRHEWQQSKLSAQQEDSDTDLSEDEHDTEHGFQSEEEGDVEDREHHIEHDFRCLPSHFLWVVVNTWRICWQDQHVRRRSRTRADLVETDASNAMSVAEAPSTVLHRVLNYVEQGLILPNHVAYGMLVTALIRQAVQSPNQKQRTDDIDALVQQLRRHYQKVSTTTSDSTLGVKFPLPKAVISPVLMYWAHHCHEHADAPVRVERYLQELERAHQEQDKDDELPVYRPDDHIYALVISTLVKHANAGKPTKRNLDQRQQAAQRACSLLAAAQAHGAATVVVYNAVLDALAKAGQSFTARQIFDKMLSSVPPPPPLVPIKATKASRARRQAAAKAEAAAALERAKTPQADYYSLIAMCLAYSMSHQPTVLHEFLQSMEAWFQEQRTPALESSLRPNLHCYNILLQCHVHSRSDPREVELVLQEMQTLSEQRPAMRPNLASYNHVLNAFAWNSSTVRSRQDDANSLLEAAERATNVFLQMKAPTGSRSHPQSAGSEPMPDEETLTAFIQPDRRSYNFLLECYANHHAVAAKYAPFAQFLVTQLGESKVGIAPNEYTYNAMIRIWGKAGHPEKAEEVLRSVCSMFLNDANHVKGGEVVPRTKLFNSVVLAWVAAASTSEDRRDEAVNRISSLMEEMKRYHDTFGLPTQPDHVTHQAFEECCGQPSQVDEHSSTV
jgi:pentatricopeptide repeat protein